MKLLPELSFEPMTNPSKFFGDPFRTDLQEIFTELCLRPGNNLINFGEGLQSLIDCLVIILFIILQQFNLNALNLAILI